MWKTIIFEALILSAYIFVAIKLLDIKIEFKKYIRFTETTHTGISFRFFPIRFVLHYVKAHKEKAVINEAVGFSKYKRQGKRGIGFSYYDKSLLFVIKESK